jgi:hypothetical protein
MRVGAAVGAGVLAVALTACGAAGSVAPASSPSATGASSSSTDDVPTFALLPESVLAPVPPLTYQQSATADQQLVLSGAKPAIAAVFAGGIARSLLYQGQQVGGVELYRFSRAVKPADRDSFVPFMVQGFAQVPPQPAKLGTVSVQRADGARGTGGVVYGWAHGEDVVLAWGNDADAARRIATEYLQVSGVASG